ncbi:MAG: cobyrinate a,c-diamide synthase [Nitrospirae bacterium]|nr:cobyrinate a,c-diamide synthase [Nitrospirota bacterium]
MKSGFIIAGTHSGCGKTTITLGMLAALKKKGLSVQAFKAGPDFIDTGLHSLITGRPARNLDVKMCGEGYVRECYDKHSASADISVIEGVMGMYDGEFSTAYLSTLLNLPIILVVDAYGMAESAGAVVRGFASNKCQSDKVSEYQSIKVLKYQSIKDSDTMTLCHSDTNIAGVIFNRIASERHYERVKRSVHDVPVLGYLPRGIEFEIPHRHLGLMVAEESPLTDDNIQRLADAVLKHVDVGLLIDIGTLRDGDTERQRKITVSLHPRVSVSIKIAVAYDKAFCFYYEDNLDLLRDAGAEIVRFSPLKDSSIPEGVDAIYIGGGYPEIYAGELSANTDMLRAIYDWADSGKPVYAECGGLMYLSKGIWKTEDGKMKIEKMAGVFPFETMMKEKRAQLGYREVELKDDCVLGKKGAGLRGHEFHYSEIKVQSTEHRAQNTDKSPHPPFAKGGQGGIKNSLVSVFCVLGSGLVEGYCVKNTLASYIHIHFGSNPAIAGNFIKFITECHSRTGGNPVPYCHSEQSEESLDSCFRRNDEKQKSRRRQNGKHNTYRTRKSQKRRQ